MKPDRAADGDKQFVALHKSGDFPEVVVAAADDPPKKSRRRWLIIGAIALLIVLAAILIPVGLLVIGKDRYAVAIFFGYFKFLTPAH